MLYIWLLVSILFPAPSLAQTVSPDSGCVLVTDILVAVQDGAAVFSQSMQWDTQDWITVGAIAGGTALAYIFDGEVRSFAQRNRTQVLEDALSPGYYYGNLSSPLILGGGTYLAGWIAGSAYTRETGRLALEAVVCGGIVTIALKALTGRARPEVSDGKNDFRWFESHDDFHSFPSGHTTIAFALSSVFASRIGNTYASIALFALAGSTLAQRIVADRHWFSDALLGTSIGTITGLTVVHLHESGNAEITTGQMYIGGIAPECAPACTFRIGF